MDTLAGQDSQTVNICGVQLYPVELVKQEDLLLSMFEDLRTNKYHRDRTKQEA